MGKSSITIAVNAKWNGDQLSKAESQLNRLATLTAASSRSATSDLAKQGAAWAELGGKIYNVGTKMQAVGDSLTRNVTVPIITLGQQAANSAIKFDTSMANVRKTTNMTEDEIEKLADSALELSKTQPVTADTILNIEALGAQLGVSNGKLEDFAKTVSGLDIATDMDFETAGKQMAQFANITSMSEDEFSNYASTIVDLGNNLATTESDISDMSLRLAGLTTTANFSQSEIMGMAGAMSSLGINAEAGGSAMTQIVSNITKAVANGGDELENYAQVAGLSADEFAAKWQSSPMEALEMVVQGIHDLDESGQATDTTLAQLGITSIRQADVMRRLSGNTDTLKDAVDRANTAWGNNTALTQEVDSRNESLESRLQVLQNKVEAIAITVGRPLVEAVISASDAIQPFIDFVGNLAQSFADADTGTQQMILGFVGVAAAAGPVLSTLGRVTQVIGTGVTAFGTIQQKVATYADALLTADGAQIKNYASAGTMASNLGLVNNKAVEAAGGAKNYVSAWEGMTTAADKVKGLEDKITTATAKSEAAEKTASELAKKAQEAATEAEKAGEAYKAAADKVDAAGNTATKAMKDEAREAKNVADAAEKTAQKTQTLANKAQDAADSAKILETNLRKEADATTDVFKENATLVSGWSKSTKEAEKAAKGVSSLESAISDEAGTIKQAATGTATLTTATKEGAVATAAAGTAATSAGAGFLSMAGSILAAAAPLIAITAATALITAAVADWAAKEQEAKEHTELMANATKDMGDIMAGASSNASALGSAIGDIEIDADSTSQALADLNASVSDTFTEVDTNSAKLDRYVSTIEELAGRSDLSATQQYRLKEAVEGYNDVCGTSYEVTQDANGALQITADKTQVSTDKLRDNADQWKKTAEAAAYSQMATKYLEIQIEAQQKLQLAQEKQATKADELATAQQKLSKFNQEHVNELANMSSQYDSVRKEQSELQKAFNDAQEAYDKAGDKVNDLTKDVESAGKSYAYLEAAAAASAAGCDQATQQAAGSIGQTLSTMGDKVTQAMSDAGINVSDFSVKLAQAGVSSESMSSISSGAFAAMASACGGNIDTLVAMIQQYNNQEIDGKTGEIKVKDGNLVDAQGHILEWNGTEFVHKETEATVEGNGVDGSAAGQVKFTSDTIAAMNGKSVMTQVSGNATDGTAATSIGNTKTQMDSVNDKMVLFDERGNVIDGTASVANDTFNTAKEAITDKTVAVNATGNVPRGEAQTAAENAEIADAALTDHTVSVTTTGNVPTGDSENKTNKAKESIDRLYSKTESITTTGNVPSGASKLQSDLAKSSIDRLSPKNVPVTANGNVIGGGAKTDTDNLRKSIDKTDGKNVKVRADVSGKSAVDNLRNAINWLQGKTVNVFANIFKNNAAGGIRLATGGIRTHADGGIVSYAKRYHAHGNIVNNPGPGVPLDIVGEAGAEAIVPLTNKRYSKPFARTIAEQMAEVNGGGGRTYVVNINGTQIAANGRAQEYIEALFGELNLTNEMGVY